MLKKDVAGYSESKNITGLVIEFSYVKNTVTLCDFEGEYHELPIDDVIELEYLGELNGSEVYRHDVVQLEDGDCYEVDLGKDGALNLYALKEDFSRGELTATTERDFPGYEGIAEVIGNVFEIRNAEVPVQDFNIKIVRELATNTYYYAGKNRETEHIDLIKVIFMGSQLIEEEAYEAFSLTYAEFDQATADGMFEDVEPDELLAYFTNLLYGTFESDDESEDGFEDEFEVEDDEQISDDEIEGHTDHSTEEDEDEHEPAPKTKLFESCKECGNNAYTCKCEVF